MIAGKAPDPLERQYSLSHDRQQEDMVAKARWFQSLSFQERADILCQYTDLILALNPKIVERKNAEPVAGRILVVTLT